MKHQLKYWIMPLVLGFAFTTGCQQTTEKPAADRVHEVLADSSSRAMVEQSISTDHQMSMEMMHHMIMQAKTDTSMGSDMYKTMMADSSTKSMMQMRMTMGSSMGGSCAGGSSMGGSAMGGSCDMSGSKMKDSKMKDSKSPDHSGHHPASESMKMKM